MSVPGAVGQRMTRGSLLLEPQYLSALAFEMLSG